MNKPAQLLATKITLSADGIDLYKGLVKICICTEGDFKLAASSRADKQELLLREPVRHGFEFEFTKTYNQHKSATLLRRDFQVRLTST